MASEALRPGTRSKGLAGPRLVVASLFFFGGACALSYFGNGGGEEGVRASIRLTARTTALLLLVVFPASALLRRWPGSATRWIVRNRRYLGLSLAVSHGYHALFIAGL